MNTPSNTMPESSRNSRIDDSPVIAPAVAVTPQPLYWSLRRELWENRSIYIAPLAVAAMFLFGFMIGALRLAGKVRGASALDPMQLREWIEQPYNFAALLIMGTTIVVAVFYCLDALHGERRDRSILFWKSLPVSDLTTVLSKAAIPIVVLPLLTFAITIATQWIMLLVNTAVFLGSGLSVAPLWRQFPLFPMWLMLLFHLVAIHGLYYAPFYGWLILVSGWARRAAFLWASLPLLAIGVVEKIAFNTSHFATLLESRLGGGANAVASTAPGISLMHPLTLITLGEFLTSPGLWIGLAIAAAFLALAVRLRRYRGPI
ncbi:MAG: ABC transporter permease [Terriglobales bacterium]